MMNNKLLTELKSYLRQLNEEIIHMADNPVEECDEHYLDGLREVQDAVVDIIVRNS